MIGAIRGTILGVVLAASLATSPLPQNGLESPSGAQERPIPEARQATVDDASAVKRIEQDWLDALNNADFAAVANILGDDFIRPAPEYGQFVTKAQVLSFYRSHRPQYAAAHGRFEGLTVSIYGATAIARGKVVTSNPDGRVVLTTLFTDVFVKRDERWQAVSAQENPIPAR